MSSPVAMKHRDLGLEALGVLVEVLSRVEEREAFNDRFYDRMCEAVCRVVRMRRAVIFRYDPALRRVRPAGSHRLDLEPFADAHVSVESASITAQALREDRLVEAEGDLRAQVAPEFWPLVAEPVRLICAPMVAGGRQIGVILCDRPLSDPPLDADERDLLWSLGKAAALASVSGAVAAQAEKARQLEHRIDLAREIHEVAIQRLFGVSMALDGSGELSAAARKRCAAEVQAALADLRAALKRPLGRAPRTSTTTLLAEVERLAAAHPELGIKLERDRATKLPAALEPLAQSVLQEAVRNARKHGHPTYVTIRLSRKDEASVLEIENDGAQRSRRQAGMGLRLAALEALHSGGVLEFGERRPGVWQIRLVVPDNG